MTTLTAPDELRIPTEPCTGPQLRLRRAGRLERTVALQDGKCTIGSSPRCQVRLPASEAQPLQCLLSLEAGVAEVTRWSAGVLLNGREFSKHTLNSGDRLSIGPWELEWQSPETASANPQSSRKSTPVVPAADEASTEVDSSADEPSQIAAESWSSAPQVELQTALLPPGPERETVDFVPVIPQTQLVDREPDSPASPVAASIEQVAPLSDTLVRETDLLLPAPAATTDPAQTSDDSAPLRPAAKTALVSSRLTEWFNGLLGPAPPQGLPTADVDAVPAAWSSASAAFEDQVVQRLWSANFAGRRRARALVDATRAGRLRCSELDDAIAELSRQCQVASAAAASTAAELETRQSELQAKLSEAVAQRDELVTELEALRTARSRTAPPDPRLQMLSDALAGADREATELREQLAYRERELESLREQMASAEASHAAAWQLEREAEDRTRDAKFDAERAEWEKQHAMAVQETDRLREQLYACESQIEPLREQVAEADAARAVIQEQFAALEQQQSQWLAECQVLESERRAALAAVAAERDALAAAERDANASRDQLAVRERDLDSLREQMARVEAKHAEQRTDLEAIDRERAGVYDADRAAWETQRVAIEQESDRLREQLDACESQIEPLREQVAEADAARAAIQAQFTELEQQQCQWLAERQALESERADALTTVAAEREALAAAEREAKELRDQLADRHRELESLREQMASAGASHADWRNDQEAADRDRKAASDAERAAWEQQRTAIEQEANRLREQLHACESQIEPLRKQLAEADAARAAIQSQFAVLEQQQSQWLAECQALESEREAAFAAVAAERDDLKKRIDDLESASIAPAASPRKSAVTELATPAAWPEAVRSETSRATKVATADESSAATETAPTASWQVWEGSSIDAARDEASLQDSAAWDRPAIDLSSPVEEQAPNLTAPEPTVENTSVPAPEATKPNDVAASFEPTSFIEKYRHLLDEGDAEASPRQSWPTLDEEYQPATSNESPGSREEDSDEALEAYMSNMMRRVRGDSPSATAASAAARFLENPPEDAGPVETPSPIKEPAIEVDANGLLRLARKRPTVSTNLAALRELANTSARTAIAHHHKRRHVQSALTKALICALASALSAYLMLTSPGVYSSWFWGGCVTSALAAATGAQLLAMACHRLLDRRKAAPVEPTLSNMLSVAEPQPSVETEIEEQPSMSAVDHPSLTGESTPS